MEDIKTTSQLFSGYKIPTKKSRRTERGDLVDYFFEKINSSRKKDRFKEYPKSSIGYFLSPFSTGDLYSLRIKCDQANSFSKMFWHYVRPK